MGKKETYMDYQTIKTNRVGLAIMDLFLELGELDHRIKAKGKPVNMISTMPEQLNRLAYECCIRGTNITLVPYFLEHGEPRAKIYIKSQDNIIGYIYTDDDAPEAGKRVMWKLNDKDDSTIIESDQTEELLEGILNLA